MRPYARLRTSCKAAQTWNTEEKNNTPHYMFFIRFHTPYQLVQLWVLRRPCT